MKTKITANQITTLSTILTLIGAYLFLYEWWVGIIGIILLQIGHIFDLSDGEVARIKGQLSEFGGWWDSIQDRIKFAFIIFIVGLKGFFATSNVWYLIYTILAVFNITMVGLMTMVKEHVSFGVNTGEISGNKKVFIGGGAIVVVLATISVLFKIYWLTIVFFATIGMLMWMMQIYNHIQNAKKRGII